MHFNPNRKNENGYMLIMVMMILSILTVIGIAAIRVSMTERESASNEQINELAFYAAEAGRYYVPQRPSLYHEKNITVGEFLNFPDTEDASIKYDVGNLISFHGSIEYLGATNPPRGSGYEAGKFKAHRYLITSTGYCSTKSSMSRIESAFYRVGF